MIYLMMIYDGNPWCFNITILNNDHIHVAWVYVVLQDSLLPKKVRFLLVGVNVKWNIMLYSVTWLVNKLA